MPNGLTPVDKKKLQKIIDLLKTQEELQTTLERERYDEIIQKLNDIQYRTSKVFLLLQDQKGGKRKTRHRRRRKRFRKGTKSKTHRGKDFETRKTSKNYNSKRWKRMTGRRTRRAPLFPWA